MIKPRRKMKSARPNPFIKILRKQMMSDQAYDSYIPEESTILRVGDEVWCSMPIKQTRIQKLLNKPIKYKNTQMVVVVTSEALNDDK